MISMFLGLFCRICPSQKCQSQKLGSRPESETRKTAQAVKRDLVKREVEPSREMIQRRRNLPQKTLQTLKVAMAAAAVVTEAIKGQMVALTAVVPDHPTQKISKD